jgi:hypothetical protein
MKKAPPDSKYTDEVRAILSSHLKGKKRPPEVCEKIRLAKLGKKRPADVVERIAAANRGKKRTPEVREKMSLARKEWYQNRTPEQKKAQYEKLTATVQAKNAANATSECS